MKSINKLNKLALALLFVFCGYFTTKACSPLSTPVLTSTLMVGNWLYVNVQSVTVWSGCTNSVQIELVCNGSPMPGVAPFFYTSPGYLKNATPFTVPTMSVPLGALCQGGVYQWRWREAQGCCTFSPWSIVYSFTMPGVPIPTTLTLNAAPPAICFPQTSQLTASVSGGCGGGGLISYSWTPATGLSCNTCSNPIANPTVTTIYTCVVSGSGPGSCWSATGTLQVISFTAAPLVGALNAPASLCAGQANTVSIASYSGSIQWRSNFNGGAFANLGAPNTQTIITPTLSPGNYCYYVSATGCGGSLNSSTVCTMVNITPTVVVNQPTICSGQTASLIAGGAANYTWSAGAAPINAPNPFATPTVNTSYTVIGATNGCTASAVSNVTVVPSPIVNLASNSAVCAGNILNLTSTGGGVYQWSGPGGFSSGVQNPTIPNANATMMGVYQVVVTTSACVTTKTINVIILTPTVSATNTGPYCSTFSVQLNGASTPGSTYSWSGPAGFNAITQSASILNATTSATGIYTLTINDGTCTATATTSVTVYPLPVPVAICNAPICEASALTFSGSGGTSYVWKGPNNYTSLSQNPTINSAPTVANGLYTLTVTDINGCVQKTIINATVKPLPVVNVTAAYLCIGQTANLTSSGGISYAWSGPNGFSSSQQNISFPNVNMNQVGDYTVVVTAANGCTVGVGSKVVVYPLPMPIASCSGSVCLGGKVTFQSSGGLLYQWTGPNGFISDEANTSIANANSMNYNGTYTLGVTDNNGCQGVTTTQLLVRGLPSAEISSTVNKKCVPFCSSFTVNSSSQLQNVQWNLNNTGLVGGTSYNNCFNQSGNFQLRSNFTDNFGCTNTNTFIVNVYPIPMADFHIGQGAPIENDAIDFKDASLGEEINSWTWFIADNNNISYNQNPNYTFAAPGAYPVTLIIANKWGCKDTVTKPIIVGEDFSLYVPNIFTPNGDGVNDTFQPKGYGIVKYNLQIFDRWGEKMYETTDLTKGWDGMYKGKVGKDESYVWKITVNNAQGKQKEYTGHVSILK